MNVGYISLTLALPLVGALVLALIPETYGKALKSMALLFSVATFGASLAILSAFQMGGFRFQLVEAVPWLPSLGIQYKVGIDGISLWLVLLTTFLTVISIWFSFYVKNRIKAYFVMLLILETAMLGVFVSLDLILFYTFFEASLIPMAVLIWIWGGENRNYAAIKFFLYTFAASIFMLVGMIVLAQLHRQATGALSFDLLSIQREVAQGRLWAGAIQLQTAVFWAFAVAFMVKCPMFPFHTWLPDAHTEAPTAGSVILAGVLLKMGTYGFLRFLLPLFPDVLPAQIPILMGLAIVGILYGAIVAAMQPDVKRLIAYSSVAHMGFVTLGIFSLTHVGMMGGAFQQLAHGISTGGLFLLVGLIYERLHTRLFANLGGIKAQMPIYAALFLIVMLSSVGLPGTNGFIGEFLAMLGAFQAGFAGMNGLGLWVPVLAGLGVILAAVYLLWMFQKVFYGPITNPQILRLKDLKGHEIAMMCLLIVFVFWGGLHPNTFLRPMEPAIHALRHMATNPVGERPDWIEPDQRIEPDGTYVRYGEVVAPANLFAKLPWEVHRASTHGPEEAH